MGQQQDKLRAFSACRKSTLSVCVSTGKGGWQLLISSSAYQLRVLLWLPVVLRRHCEGLRTQEKRAVLQGECARAGPSVLFPECLPIRPTCFHQCCQAQHTNHCKPGCPRTQQPSTRHLCWGRPCSQDCLADQRAMRFSWSGHDVERAHSFGSRHRVRRGPPMPCPGSVYIHVYLRNVYCALCSLTTRCEQL